MYELFFASFLSAGFAYLLGSITFAIVITKMFTGKDIRSMGSGNAGMTNVLRSVGKPAAALTAIGDILKGTVAVIIGRHIFNWLTDVDPIYGAYIAAIFAIMGHLFPIYFKFKGGKGVSVAAGSVLAINPTVVGVLIVVFLLVVFTTKIVSLASITVAALYPVCTGIYTYWQGGNIFMNVIFSSIIGVTVIVMHRANIKRLLNGTEYKFGQKRIKNENKKDSL